MGTFPHWREEDVMETIVQLQGKGKKPFLGYFGGKENFGSPIDADSPFMRLIPASELAFNANHSNSIKQLIIHGKSSNVIAHKVKKHYELMHCMSLSFGTSIFAKQYAFSLHVKCAAN